MKMIGILSLLKLYFIVTTLYESFSLNLNKVELSSKSLTSKLSKTSVEEQLTYTALSTTERHNKIKKKKLHSEKRNKNKYADKNIEPAHSLLETKSTEKNTNEATATSETNLHTNNKVNTETSIKKVNTGMNTNASANSERRSRNSEIEKKAKIQSQNIVHSLMQTGIRKSKQDDDSPSSSSSSSNSVTGEEDSKPLFPIGNPLNRTQGRLSTIAYQALNNSVSDVISRNLFHRHARKWDWNMVDKELEGIVMDMTYRTEIEHSTMGIRNYLQQFLLPFENCDTDFDNVLNYTEFKACLGNDTFLVQLSPPREIEASFINFTFTNDTGYNSLLFSTFDIDRSQYINFAEYMLLRLYIYSWRKCSVLAPSIEEVGFECAIEVCASYKTISHSTARKIFYQGLQLSNSESRSLDFITFSLVANTVRLYSKINMKEDTDATKAEFDRALDDNVLPKRYNAEIIKNFFDLTKQEDKVSQGMDLLSFIFYDFHLRIFEQPMITIPKRQYKYLDFDDFTACLNHYLFPKNVITAIQRIPQNNLTENSYQMFMYLNTTQYNSERDHFYNFMEIKNKVRLSKKSESMLRSSLGSVAENKKGAIPNFVRYNSKLAFQSNYTYKVIFDVLDINGDGLVTFYDYAGFIQVGEIFTKFDEFNVGKIYAKELYNKALNYYEYPTMSHVIRERAQRFSLIPVDFSMDIFNVLLVLKIDDLMASSVRKSDKATIYEYELRNIFKQISWDSIPPVVINGCLRDYDDRKIPVYDWECSFMNSIKAVLTYYQSSYAYLVTKTQNITLSNTLFFNIDPQLVPPIVTNEDGSEGSSSSSSSSLKSGEERRRR